MRAVVQRVTAASVVVDGATVGAIGRGVLMYLGLGHGDDDAAQRYVIDKVLALRIFADEHGKMNRSVVETGGAVLVVSQFTLYGDVRKGRRPGFDAAMPPDEARVRYERFLADLGTRGVPMAAGIFGADMQVHAQVDGPITLLVDSARLF